MPTSALRAASITNALGVQTDLQVGNWTTIAAMISEAEYIGATSVRVGVTTASNWTSRYGYTDQLANAGLKMDFVVDTSATPADNVAAITAFAIAHPGSIALVEGPNEPNNWGVNYNGLTGVAGAIAWQSDFYGLMKANPLTALIDIAGVSSYPVVNVASDENNLHLYPSNGVSVRQQLISEIAAQNAVSPGHDFAITETGWSTDPNSSNGVMLGVDEITQAKLVLDVYLDAMSLGATHVGLYELKDWVYTDYAAYYGLNHSDGSPKIAATALHAVSALLSDTGSSANTFVPGSLDFKISGGSDVYSLLSEKSDGTFVLALWREPPMWNSATGTEISSHGENLTVSFDSEFSISLSNPIDGTSLHPEFASNSITFELTDEPVFLTLSAIPVAIATVSGGSATISESAIHPAALNSATFDLLANIAGHDNSLHSSMTDQGHSLHIVNSTVSISTSNGVAETLSPGTDFVMNSDGTISLMSGQYTADLHDGQKDIVTVHYSVSDGTVTSAPVDFVITVNGTPDLIFGNGVISGTAYDDQIYGDSDPVGHVFVGAVNDAISGGAGDDALYGGDGDDILDGGPGNDILDGGSGINTASYVDAYSVDGVGVTVDLTRFGIAQDTHIAGMDTLFNIQNIIGSSYDDMLTGDANANNIQGGFGNDTINGGDGNDYLLGNQGDDVITGGNGDDYIHGGQGNDTIYGNVGNDELHGGVGDDTLYGGQGNDTLYGESGNDVIEGGLGNDVIDGGTGINTVTYIYAASTDGVGVTVDLTRVGVAQDTHIAGMDTLFNIQNIIGSSYDDMLTGDANANNIQGGAGNDTIHGGAGDDTLYGNVGNDVLHGDVGDDTLYGGQGNDTLYGDSGTNTLFGNLGADTFVMDPTGHDTIGDFSQAQGDKIDLSGIDAISNNAPGTLDHFTYVAGGVFTGAAGQLIIVQTDATHYLVEGDTNGDGHADYMLTVSSPDGTAPNQNAFTASSFAAASSTTDATHAAAHEAFLFG